MLQMRDAAWRPFVVPEPGSATLGLTAAATWLLSRARFWRGRTDAPYSTKWRRSGEVGRIVLLTALMWMPSTARADGVLFAQGKNNYGQDMAPVGLTNAAAVGSGNEHALAVRLDGTVQAWGAYAAGKTNVPAGLSNVVAVAGGYNHSLALKQDGTVVPWGQDVNAVPGDLTNAIQIASDVNYAMALTADGRTRTWGIVPLGFRGDATNVVAISVGGWHALMLKPDGGVIGYGMNPPELTNAVAIAAGYSHGLALRADGTVVAWGANNLGQTNVPEGLSNVVAIATGAGVSVAFTADGRVFTWGEPSMAHALGEVTNATSVSFGAGFAVGLKGEGAPSFTTPFADRAVVAEAATYLVAHATGSLPMNYQWRRNGIDIPGATKAILTLPRVAMADTGTFCVRAANARGSVTSRGFELVVVPVQLIAGPADTNVMVGSTVSFEVTARGREPLTYQWQFNGQNIPGQTDQVLVLQNVAVEEAGGYSVTISNELGGLITEPGYLNVRQVVERVDWFDSWTVYVRTNQWLALTNIVAISAGGWFYSHGHTLALRADGQVLAWGNNHYGETFVPNGLSNVVAIAAGDGHSMALDGQGKVFTWGRDLGENDITPGLSNVVAIAAGDNRVALKSDGTLVIWGKSSPGEPDLPKGLSNCVAISPFVALREDGTMTSWGAYYRVSSSISNVVQIASCPTRGLGRTADGAFVGWGTAPESVPDAATNEVAVACSRSHFLYLLPDGTVFSWPAISNVLAIAVADGYSVAMLGNRPPPLNTTIVNPHRGADGFSLYVEGESGRVYRLEYKKSLSDPDWASLPLVAGRAGLLKLTDATPAGEQRFYRVRRW